MLKSEMESLLHEIKSLFDKEDKIKVGYCANLINRIEERRLVDFKNIDGSYRADYIDSGHAGIILSYDGIDARKQIEAEIDNILRIVAKHGFSNVNESEHSLSRTREYGEVIITFDGIKE